MVQAQQLQQQLQHQPPAISHKAALQIGEVATQKLIQLDDVHVTGGHAALAKMHSLYCWHVGLHAPVSCVACQCAACQCATHQQVHFCTCCLLCH